MKRSVFWIIGITCLIIVTLAGSILLKGLSDYSHLYGEAEKQQEWAWNLSYEITDYYQKTGKWISAKEELPQINFTGKNVIFLPTENPNIACVVKPNSQFHLLIQKSGEVILHRTNEKIK